MAPVSLLLRACSVQSGGGSLGLNLRVLGLQSSHFTTRACREHSNKNRSDDCKAEGNIPRSFSIWPLYLQCVLKFFERWSKLNRSVQIDVASLKFTALSLLYMLSVFLRCVRTVFFKLRSKCYNLFSIMDYYTRDYMSLSIWLSLLLCLALSGRFMCLFFGVYRPCVFEGICENLSANCEHLWCITR